MQMKFSDGQSEFSRVFNFAILGYSRNLRKLDARENIVFYSSRLDVSTQAWTSHTSELQHVNSLEILL